MSKPIHRPPSKPAGTDPVPPRKSGRVQFDERGQAVWEWAVQTGMFDRNASTQRVRALSEAASMTLEVTETPAQKSATAAPVPRRGDAVTPYDTAPAKPVPPRAPPKAPPPARRPESAGSDPYSRGPAKRPESMSFNPYERTPTRGR